MTVADTVKEKVAQLPSQRQLEVLDFVDFLSKRAADRGPRRDPEGILAGKIPDISLEDFKANRREMSQGFPREFEP